MFVLSIRLFQEQEFPPAKDARLLSTSMKPSNVWRCCVSRATCKFLPLSFAVCYNILHKNHLSLRSLILNLIKNRHYVKLEKVQA